MLRLLFWALVLLLALSFFGISVRAIVMSPMGQENFGYAYQLVIEGWHFVMQGWSWFTGLFLN